jgi:hypothetical protein
MGFSGTRFFLRDSTSNNRFPDENGFQGLMERFHVRGTVIGLVGIHVQKAVMKVG